MCIDVSISLQPLLTFGKIEKGVDTWHHIGALTSLNSIEYLDPLSIREIVKNL